MSKFIYLSNYISRKTAQFSVEVVMGLIDLSISLRLNYNFMLPNVFTLPLKSHILMQESLGWILFF